MKTRLFHLLAILFLSCNAFGLKHSERISTKLGDIVGVDYETEGGLPFTSFFGIRYGQEPGGELFLQKPVPALPWNGTFVADEQVICLQVSDGPTGRSVSGQNDCLAVNVHTTNKLKKESLLPVMVFIHGGTFNSGSGSSDSFGPERFLDYGIILVTLNYRLGPLGFMSTGDDIIPGNMGLWDQNLALKWVQQNIEDFGGDPNRVTLFGESAGAMSASFHVLSQQSKGLFHGTIWQSGSATTTHLKPNYEPIYYSRGIAERVGCEPDLSSEKLLECFLQAGPSAIADLNFMFDLVEKLPLVFKPEIDNFTSDPFLPKSSWEIIESGEFNHVPTIIGANAQEGLISSLFFYENKTFIDELAEKWDKSYGPLVIFHSVTNIDDEMLDLVQVVSDYYFPETGLPNPDNILKAYVDLFGDVNFNAIGSVTARKMAEKSTSKVYEYYYKHLGSFGLFEFLLLPEWQKMAKIYGQTIGLNLYTPQHGVAHCDEMFMMFKANGFPLETVFTEEDKATSKNMLKIWTDFAKTGNPTPDPEEIGVLWENLSSTNNNRLEIGSGTLEIALNQVLEKRIEFWSKIWNI